MGTRFLDALHSGRVLLMDGAMGTELQRAGMPPGACYEEWNLRHPERVQAIHRAYADAGAEVLLTNTFQANPEALARHDGADTLDRLCAAAVYLASIASQPRGFVLASIGPFPTLTAVLDRLAAAMHGTDGLLLETLSDPFPLNYSPVRPALGPPVLLSYAYSLSPKGGLRTSTGWAPEEIAYHAALQQVAALGVNCGRDISMEDCAEILRRYRSATDLPLFARPNAGSPAQVDGRWVYPHTPEAMAAKLPLLLEAGAAMVGGCCGTTPEHIAAFRRVVEAWNLRK